LKNLSDIFFTPVNASVNSSFFYLWLSIAAHGYYRLCRKLPGISPVHEETVKCLVMIQNINIPLYSQYLSSARRIKLTTLYTATIVRLLFLDMSGWMVRFDLNTCLRLKDELPTIAVMMTDYLDFASKLAMSDVVECLQGKIKSPLA
jgi:hypothetical protein